jgi:hypothetical protein
MIEGKIISKAWIYKNVFNFSPDDILEIESGIIKDQKELFRTTKIAEEGEDPESEFNKKKKAQEEAAAAKEEKEGGKEGEEKEETGTNPFGEGVDKDLEKEYEEKEKKERKTPKVPEGGWPGAGRPKEGVKYNTHAHPRGYDPTGRVAWKNARNESTDVIKKYGLEKLVTKKSLILNETISMIDEANILPEGI